MTHQLLRTGLALCAVLAVSSFGLTKHAVVLVMDGARYTETMGDPSHANVPKIAALASQGVVLSAFVTARTGSVAESWTETCPGHARITTGTYQNIANDGTVLPTQPSMFQQYRQQQARPASSGWVICSKDKLFILANTSASAWNGQYQPSMNCGVNGNGSGGYREDNLTHDIVKQRLVADRPALLLINYKGPDAMGHANNWSGYLAAIRQVDGYAEDLWNTIQADDSLKNTTALFIVNDHGRHAADFTSHGDNCVGCRSVMCVALGPDIKTDVTSATTREQIDLAPTIASMMGFSMPTSAGEVMSEIFKPTSIAHHGADGAWRPSLVATWSASSSRSLVLNNLPGDAVIDILTVSGAHLARLTGGQSTVSWAAPLATQRVICTVRSMSEPRLQVLIPTN
jgi:hypothetical protein